MNYSTQDFENLLENNQGTSPIEVGSLIKGKVVKVLRDFVIVDVGMKSEGQIPIIEFQATSDDAAIDAGQEVEVVFESMENYSGLIQLSKEKADALHAWDDLVIAEKEGTEVEGVIVSKIKGGMVVNVSGVKAFLPGSQIDLKPIKGLDRLVGERFTFSILKLNKEKNNVVLSRRAILEKERASQRADLLSNITEGQVVEGVVKNVTDYGAFIDLGGVDGLLHITDMTWGRINHPSEMLTAGEMAKVVVLKFDKDNQKVSLGIKQLQADPWEDVDHKFPINSRIKGKVVNITDYGAFIEISDGFEGLVHISEMTWSKKIKHPSKIVTVGDEVEAQVLNVDKENRRISLGIKQVEENPWDQLESKFPKGKLIKGTVKNVTDFGVFVGIDDEIDGLVHVSDFSWAKTFTHPSDLYNKGDEVEAVVLNLDIEQERISLGVKQLAGDPYQVIHEKFPPSSTTQGKVVSMDAKGMTLDLGDSVSGFMAMTQYEGDAPKVGDSIEGQVIQIDDKEKKVILSSRALTKSTQKQGYADFKSKQGHAKATIGDLLKDSDS